MSIVLVILAVILGISITVGAAQLDVAKIKGTQRHMNLLHNALVVYESKHGRYPCPARLTDAADTTNYAREKADCATDCTDLQCAGATITGFVPIKTLSLPDKLGYDGWDRRITYVVDRNHVTTSGLANGTITLSDANGNDITASPLGGDSIFALISHGDDQKGSYTRSGLRPLNCGTTSLDDENCDGDAVFTDSHINATGSVADATYYNDYVVWHTQEKLAP